MSPPRILFVLCLGLAPAVALAAPSAPLPRLDDLQQTLSRQLVDEVAAVTARLSAAAFERQTQALLSLHAGEEPVARDAVPTGRMRCIPAPDATLHCLVVADRFAGSAGDGLAAAER